MCDPQRVERMLQLIREIWSEMPDWRLGQMIINAARRDIELPDSMDIYSIEDENMEDCLVRLLTMLKDSAPSE